MSSENDTAKKSDESHAHHPSYVKIWAILVVLLGLSVAGPHLGIEIITLITAFGIAVVKAYLVAKHFMHVNLEKRYVVYLIATCLGFMGLLYAGVAPDVMRHSGRNWHNLAAQDEVKRAIAEHAHHAKE